MSVADRFLELATKCFHSLLERVDLVSEFGHCASIFFALSTQLLQHPWQLPVLCLQVTSSSLLSLKFRFHVSQLHNNTTRSDARNNRLAWSRYINHARKNTQRIARKPTLTLSSSVVSNCYTPKCSATYWSNPPFLIFWHLGTLELRNERQNARMSKNLKGWVTPVWRWTLL